MTHMEPYPVYNVTLDPSGEFWVDWNRQETDPCERNTVGCCIRHGHQGLEPDRCETW